METNPSFNHAFHEANLQREMRLLALSFFIFVQFFFFSVGLALYPNFAQSFQTFLVPPPYDCINLTDSTYIRVLNWCILNEQLSNFLNLFFVGKSRRYFGPDYDLTKRAIIMQVLPSLGQNFCFNGNYIDGYENCKIPKFQFVMVAKPSILLELEFY